VAAAQQPKMDEVTTPPSKRRRESSPPAAPKKQRPLVQNHTSIEGALVFIDDSFYVSDVSGYFRLVSGPVFPDADAVRASGGGAGPASA
jgi:hypothetical protein